MCEIKYEWQQRKIDRTPEDTVEIIIERLPRFFAQIMLMWQKNETKLCHDWFVCVCLRECASVSLSAEMIISK